MGKFDEYITSLDGKDDLNVIEVVAELAKLHNDELSFTNSKVEQLNSQLAEKDTAIAAKDSEISKVKAANWDLVNQIPSESSDENPEQNDGDTIDQKRITLDDAFIQ